MKSKNKIIISILVILVLIGSLIFAFKSCENGKPEEQNPVEPEFEDSYVVIFNNIDGTELQKTEVKTLEIPEYLGEEPKYDDEYYTYTFAGWDKELEEVKSDQVYTAIYDRVKKETVTTNPVTEKKKPKVTEPVSLANLVYDGTEKAIITSGSTSGGTILYALGTSTGPTESYTTSIPKAKNAGTYYVWYKVVGNSTYKDVSEKLVTVVVPKRTIVLTSDSNEKTYDGSPLTDSDVTKTGDDFISGEGAVITATGSQTKAGTSKNTISCSLNPGTDENNYDITKVEGDLTVNKVKVTLPNANTGLVYNGSEQVGVTLPANSKYTLSNNKTTNAGDFNATATLNDKENYEWDLVTPVSTDQTIAFSVSKKDINVIAVDKKSNALSPLVTLTYTADSLIGSDTFSGSLQTDANINVGKEYDITQGTLTAGSNYNIIFTGAKYEVEKLSQTLTFSGITDDLVKVTYGDSKFTKTVTGANTTVTYESSATTVATIDSKTGEVTPIAVGSSTIKAKAAESDIYLSAEKTYKVTIGYTVTLALDESEMVGDSDNDMIINYADGSSSSLTFDNVGLWGDGAIIDGEYEYFPFTLWNVSSISRTESFISYSINGLAYPIHEFKNGDYVLSNNITITGTGTGNCLDENTLVTMWDGTKKAMKDIELGDLVLSIDYDSKRLVPRKVIYTSKDDPEYEKWTVPAYYLYKFSDGTIIKRAMRHRFYCLETRSYKHMDTWEVGLHTYSENGKNPKLLSIEIIYEPLHYARITLEDSNNYFANGLSTGDSECCPNKVKLTRKLKRVKLEQ